MIDKERNMSSEGIIQGSADVIHTDTRSPFVKFDLVVQAQQTPGVVLFNNYEQLKTSIGNGVSYYSQFEYSLENYQIALKHHNELKHVKNVLEKTKREIVKNYNAPLEIVEKRIDELIDLIKIPYKKVDTFIKQNEKNSKKYEIYCFAKEVAAAKGLQEHMEDIFRSPAFFDEKWLNTSCSGTSWKTAVSEKLDNAAKDINHILSSQNDNKAGILAHYYQTLSMDRVAEFSDSLKKTSLLADNADTKPHSVFAETDEAKANKGSDAAINPTNIPDFKDSDILSYVANSINPYTGEVITGIDDLLKLRLEDISHNLQLTDNVYFTMRFKKADKSETQCKEDGFTVWKKWTTQEDLTLIEEFNQGLSVSEIAEKHNRTAGGIRSRLKKHKLVD